MPAKNIKPPNEPTNRSNRSTHANKRHMAQSATVRKQDMIRDSKGRYMSTITSAGTSTGSRDKLPVEPQVPQVLQVPKAPLAPVVSSSTPCVETKSEPKFETKSEIKSSSHPMANHPVITAQKTWLGLLKQWLDVLKISYTDWDALSDKRKTEYYGIAFAANATRCKDVRVLHTMPKWLTFGEWLFHNCADKAQWLLQPLNEEQMRRWYAVYKHS